MKRWNLLPILLSGTTTAWCDQDKSASLFWPDDKSMVWKSQNSQNTSLFICYDNRTKNPKYVIERFNSSHATATNESSKRKHNFFAESSIQNESFKIHPKDYNDSRYDRGHMAPAADFAGNQELVDATFTMANISPQVLYSVCFGVIDRLPIKAPVLNKTFWSVFESWVRSLTKNNAFEEVTVITGPVFAPIFIQNEWVYINKTIGTFPKLIHVPTHFYKLIIVKHVGSNHKYSVGAFMVPNVNTVNTNDPLCCYLVRLDQLETILGYGLLDNVMDIKERKVIDDLIPESRDLSIVLNSKNVIYNDKLNTSETIHNVHELMNVNNQVIDKVKQPYERSKLINIKEKTSNTNNNNHIMMKKLEFYHLCDSVDCNRSIRSK